MALINLLFLETYCMCYLISIVTGMRWARGIKPCNSAVSGHMKVIVASCYKIYKFLNALPTKINQTEDRNKQQ